MSTSEDIAALVDVVKQLNAIVVRLEVVGVQVSIGRRHDHSDPLAPPRAELYFHLDPGSLTDTR